MCVCVFPTVLFGPCVCEQQLGFILFCYCFVGPVCEQQLGVFVFLFLTVLFGPCVSSSLFCLVVFF